MPSSLAYSNACRSRAVSSGLPPSLGAHHAPERCMPQGLFRMQCHHQLRGNGAAAAAPRGGARRPKRRWVSGSLAVPKYPSNAAAGAPERRAA